LIGENVENPDGDNIGKVKDLVLDPRTGQVKQVVVGVGGFLGLGQKDVALPWDQLQIRQEVPRTASAPAPGTTGTARAPESSPGAPGTPATRAERTPGSEAPAASRDVARAPETRLVLNMTKEQLQNAPEYEEDKGPTLGMAPTAGSSSRDTER